MEQNDRLIQNRFRELAERSRQRDIYTYSDFLDMAEQAALDSLHLRPAAVLEGGFPGAERKIACFGNEDELGYPPCPPIVCLLIEPASARFSDELSHRDILGAVMNLGIKRETTGDMILLENRTWLFCLDSVAGFIAENLTTVKHTTVKITTAAGLPEGAAALPEITSLVAASERADAAVAAVFGLSRSQSSELFSHGRVFVNSRATENVSQSLSAGDIVSARGFGRFRYEGVERETRHGRLRILVRVY